jgi:arginyl-tRNA synthetase
VLHLELEKHLRAAVTAVLPDADPAAVFVRPCPDPKFGDYQSNSLIALAKARGLIPRQLATDVVAKLDVAALCEKVEIAGAGFLNFRLKPDAIAATLAGAARGEHLFFQKATPPRTYVIDFSSPNVAKPMHVGHIRSTVLGDCLARVLRVLGHRVITDNHIGDWGTQFGMLLLGWKQHLNPAALAADPIGELERVYKQVNAECQANPATLETARAELAKLQSGDAENLAIWREMQSLSQTQFDGLYARLGVMFDHMLGESFYNPRLQAVVEDLRAKGIARESDDAVCVFSDGSMPPKEDPFLIQRDGQWIPNPQIIQKRDGAFNYATTDLATIAYRLETWRPDEIIYVTDGRQQLHFRQLFATFRRWQPTVPVKLSHVWFGSILGEDGRPIKTRLGEPVKLAELLDEAQERALAAVTSKNPDLPDVERREIARVVGLGAVKYADLLPNRQSDYTFSWDKMLALNGNTAPYLLYAYARIRSIFRKGGPELAESRMANDELRLGAPEEILLAKHLLNFGLVLEAVAEESRPNFLCNYLYDLAGHFARFYEACPVLKAEGAQRATRLVLCSLTGRVLKQGLEVLGIEALEQM